MNIVFGRPYILATSHITSDVVTPWEDGTFTVDSELSGQSFERVTLEEIEQHHPHWGPPQAHVIRRELLTDAHDTCDWPWVPHPSGQGFYRAGKCPTCGRW